MKRLLLIVIVFNLFLENSLFSLDKKPAFRSNPFSEKLKQFPKFPLTPRSPSTKEIPPALEEQPVNPSSKEELSEQERYYPLKKDDGIFYKDKEGIDKAWTVISAKKTKDPDDNEIKIIKLEQYPPKGSLMRNILTLTVTNPDIKTKTFEERYSSETTLPGKIVIGALVIGGGAYLASVFAPAYFNYLVKSSTPWLQDTFKAGLEKFGFSQSK